MPVKDNNSTPRKPLIYYYIIALVVLMLLNTFLFPSLLSRPVVEVTYDAFLKMLDAGEVKQVALEDTMLVFAAEDAEGNAAIFKTGIWPDDNLTERLVNAEGVQFAAEIPTQASPLLNFMPDLDFPDCSCLSSSDRFFQPDDDETDGRSRRMP